MQPSKRRVTVQLRPKIAKAMKARAALNDQTIADVENEALAAQIALDAQNLLLVRQRRNDGITGVPLEDVLAELKEDGLL